MKLYTLNVGQGSFAVLTCQDEAIVIDCRIPGPSDAEAETIRAVLPKLLRNRNLVGLILTGFDRDHADPKGVGLIVGRYLPQWVMYPGYFKPGGFATRTFRAIKTAEEARAGGNWSLRRVSVRLDRTGACKLDDLSRHMTIEIFSPHPEDMITSNNSSLVARIAPKPGCRGFSYLVTGDTENARWERINKLFGSRICSDVMAAPHHGSRGAINSDTMKLVDPEAVLVSAGADNTYGHPHPEAVDCYEESGAEVFSTHTGSSYLTVPGWLWGANTSQWDSAAE